MSDINAMMDRALALAASHRPHPNPRVGAVVVGAGGDVIGEGAHQRPGLPHAERLALEMAGAQAVGSTVYVTLEPCSHVGRTPACVEALIDARVGRVVAAVVDPDPRVAGTGVARLRRAGIDVELGIRAAEAEALDPAYFHHRRTGRPRVTVKVAITLDGQMAAADGSSCWITDPEMRRDAADLRAEMDALVVGSGAVLADDPTLDLPAGATHHPMQFVIGGARPVPASSRIVRAGAVVLDPDQVLDHPGPGLTDPAGDRVDLGAALAHIGARGGLDVLVEGGPTLISALARAQLVDRYILYVGASLAAGVGTPMFDGVFTRIEDAVTGTLADVRRVGRGLRLEFVPDRGHG